MTKQAVATYENQIIPVPLDKLRGFIANVLNMLDWTHIMTPRDLKKITATQEASKRGNSVWNYKFKIEITYKKHSEGNTALSYIMTEKEVKIQKDCQEKLFEVMHEIEKCAADFVETVAEQPVPDTYGNSRFADNDELRKKGYVSVDTPADRLLLAPFERGQYLTVPTEFTNAHACVCGPTGAGKSSGFFIPNLVHRTESSVIVTEATAGDEVPELFAKTSGWRQFKHNKIYFFNPGYAKGTRINPLDKLKHVSQSDFAQVADELANLVIVNTTAPTATRSDPIWDKSEKHLLWIMIMHVAKSDDPEIAHFGAIRELLRKNEKQIRKVLEETKSDVAREEFESFLHHSSENFRHGVFAGLLQRLNPWLSDVIQTMTKTSDLDTSRLKHEKFSFYLSVPSRKAHLKPIAALIFNFLLDLSLEAHFDYPPALLLDEFTNYGAIPQIDDALSLIRKRNLPVVLGYQAQSQLAKIYGRETADNIVSNIGTVVFFRPARAEQAEMLSDALGERTIVDVKTDDRGFTQYREIGKPLMSVRDIQNLPPDEVIIMTKSTNPIRTKRFDHNSCPQPDGFDLPELVDHKLVAVERLSDAALEAKAKSAKVKAQQEIEFGEIKQTLESVIAAAEEKYGSPKFKEPEPEPEPEPQAQPQPTPEPKPKPKPEPKPQPAQKRDKPKRVISWEIP